MDSDFEFLGYPSKCSYLPEQTSQLQYMSGSRLTREQVQTKIQQGWRRQANMLFRPACRSCHACQSLRVVTSAFEPDRSQRRVIKANQKTVLEIRTPSVTREQIDLHVLHHNHHAEQKGWHHVTVNEALSQIKNLGSSTFIEEWSYRIDGVLVAISYIDVFPEGLSGVYFYHHPDYRQYSLGTWCVISMILRARELGMPFAYLGLYVPGCRSMEYKGRFGPAEIRMPDGNWVKFQRPEE